MASLNLNSLIRKQAAAPVAAPEITTEEVEVVAEVATPVAKPVVKALAKPAAAVTKPIAPAAKPAAPVTKPALPITKPTTTVAGVVKKAAPAPAPTALAVVEEEETAVGAPISATPLGAIDGEVTARDMAIPYPTLVQKQGKLFDTMPDALGNFVYDKQIDLGDEIEVVFLRATKYFVEDLPFESKEIPKRWSSSAMYRAEGFNDSQIKEVADLDLLIAIPQEGNEALGELTTIEHGGKWYLPSRFTVRSTAYGRTFSILVRDRSGWLKGNLLNGSYKIGTERKSNADSSWFVPTMNPGEKTTEEFREIVMAALSMG